MAKKNCGNGQNCKIKKNGQKWSSSVSEGKPTTKLKGKNSSQI